MGGLASALGHGFSQLFKTGRTRIGNAIDNYLVGGADARKAISDEVVKKFQPMIERIDRAKSKRAANITELDNKLTESKKAFQDAQADWNKKHDDALAAAKNQRQTDINNYDTQLKQYEDALNSAKGGRQSILDQLRASEATYNQYKTLYTDVSTGDTYILNPRTGAYETIDTFLTTIKPKKQQAFIDSLNNFDHRLIDIKNNNKVINAFNKSDIKNYKSNSRFDEYSNGIRAQNTNLMDAENQVKQANAALSAWKKNPNKPSAWDETTSGNNDLTKFESDFRANNGDLPNKYSFNGHDYADATELDKAYQDALTNANNRLSHANKKAVETVRKRDAEIAQRIQDAKDIKKAKLAVGGALGAGALYAGARAIYGGDDTDNGDTTNTPDNIDNTDNTYTGEPAPDFNVEKEGQAILKDRQQIDTGFDPDKAEAEAVLAGAAHDQGVEDGNSVGSSDIVTADGQHIDDGLFELLKAMKDPHKADAIANYIYSKHGDDLDVQNLGWRGWLNKYGDSLRSKMGIDPSGYKGMHISGGL